MDTGRPRGHNAPRMAGRPERPREGESGGGASEGPRQTVNTNRQPRRTREERLLHIYATRPLAVAERAMKQVFGRQRRSSFSHSSGPGGPRGPR